MLKYLITFSAGFVVGIITLMWAFSYINPVRTEKFLDDLSADAERMQQKTIKSAKK